MQPGPKLSTSQVAIQLLLLSEEGGGGGGRGTTDEGFIDEGFIVMVANEGLEKAEPIDPGPLGLRRMQCELFRRNAFKNTPTHL